MNPIKHEQLYFHYHETKLMFLKKVGRKMSGYAKLDSLNTEDLNILSRR
jgi:hypothetical protein